LIWDSDEKIYGAEKFPVHQYRIEKAEVMYRRLTIAYSTLCNSSNTPLTTEWEDNTDEKYQMLHDTFMQLQPEFVKFCKSLLSGCCKILLTVLQATRD
jgi:hypothetical protein